MSLTQDLIVSTNTCESLLYASRIQNGMNAVARIIKDALDESDLKILIKELEKKDE